MWTAKWNKLTKTGCKCELLPSTIYCPSDVFSRRGLCCSVSVLTILIPVGKNSQRPPSLQILPETPVLCGLIVWNNSSFYILFDVNSVNIWLHINARRFLDFAGKVMVRWKQTWGSITHQWLHLNNQIYRCSRGHILGSIKQRHLFGSVSVIKKMNWSLRYRCVLSTFYF